MSIITKYRQSGLAKFSDYYSDAQGCDEIFVKRWETELGVHEIEITSENTFTEYLNGTASVFYEGRPSVAPTNISELLIPE